MTPAQFDALAQLKGLHKGPTQECARLMLVDGLSQSAAAAAAGVTPQAASQALKSARRTLALARAALGLPSAE
ncbi:hypothetical protein [Hydrogenophaga electricum]|nr:hypothetical protein [Hydrogenophaga electricum]